MATELRRAVPAKRSPAAHDRRIAACGEAELIGSWAEAAFDAELVAALGTTRYEVIVTAYDPVQPYVQNRGPAGFEIHALPGTARRMHVRCGWCVVVGVAAAEEQADAG